MIVLQARTIVAVWLPYWPAERALRVLARQGTSLDTGKRQGASLDPPLDASFAASRPFALTAARKGGMRLVALNPAAEAQGLHCDQMLTDARAMVRDLQVDALDADGDRAALDRLCLWCTRFTPWAAVDGTQPDAGDGGLFLDISGCGHLFGGDRALVRQLLDHLKTFGLTARAAIAPTPGAAQALARHSGDLGDGQGIQVPGRQALSCVLAPLGIDALRLSKDTVEGLNRLGLRRIGDLYDKPRGPLAARFGVELLYRLDQALGLEGEPISPRLPKAAYEAHVSVAEPLVLAEHVKMVVGRLADDLCVHLKNDDAGALALRFAAWRTDGDVLVIEAGTSAPCGDAAHMTRLFHEKLDGLESTFDAGFGFETFQLAAMSTGRRPPQAVDLEVTGSSARDMEEFGHLVDRLGNRLGLANVRRLYPHQSHIPERAVISIPAIRGALPRELVRETHDWREESEALAGDAPHRPLCLLPCPEPIEVIAEVPEGAPLRFRWRRVAYRIVRSDGPERIAAEWWHADRSAGAPTDSGHTRDYFRLEDHNGKRFWVYRDGLYGRETDAPRWYMHGVFA